MSSKIKYIDLRLTLREFEHLIRVVRGNIYWTKDMTENLDNITDKMNAIESRIKKLHSRASGTTKRKK